MTSLF